MECELAGVVMGIGAFVAFGLGVAFGLVSKGLAQRKEHEANDRCVRALDGVWLRLGDSDESCRFTDQTH